LPKLPPDTVRGRVRGYIERHAGRLGDDVLEVGSRMTSDKTWWIVNRDLAQGAWLGMDMQPGHGVDVVADLHDLPPEWAGRFSGVLCSEVLEHVARPWVALPKLRAVIRPGGWLVVTTLFCFPEHGFPDDYYRYTRQGLQLLLEDAGFVDVATEYAGIVPMVLNDHGEGMINRRQVPMHVMAVGRVPC
jgi:SAM-dependent methyltransferase